MDIGETLRKYFAEELDKEKSVANLKDDDSLLVKGILDSIEIVKLTTFIEEAFGVPVGDEDLVPENFETITSLRRFIEGRRANG
jgi:acyl carrier protein